MGRAASQDAGVIELRRYRLHPGRRETLIDLFDREFVETQEAAGMDVLGQFRDLDDPDSFVWLRGFTDMPARAAALKAFYTGPAWGAHRDAANATMIDFDNVLLLRPVQGGHSLPTATSARPASGQSGDGPGLVVAFILHLDPREPVDVFPRRFDEPLRRQIGAAGVEIVATFVTEESPNTFPRLPVREGERVWVALGRLPDVLPRARLQAALEDGAIWSGVRSALVQAPEVLRLKPTARSLLHG